MSAGIRTGVSIVPEKLHLQETGADAGNITITLHTPLPCSSSPDHCSLNLALSVHNNCEDEDDYYYHLKPNSGFRPSFPGPFCLHINFPFKDSSKYLYILYLYISKRY